jgi:YD repeat-containing protein
MKVNAWFMGFAALALIALAGCHEVGHVGDYDDYGSYGRRELIGEIRDVDTRGREIQLRSDGGRTWRVRYDKNTRVVDGNSQRGVRDLQRGDYVALRGQEDGDGRYYAEAILVRNGVQDRGGWFGRNTSTLDVLDGTVEQIYPRRSSFEVRDRRRLVLVAVPTNAPRRISERFRDLNEGDRVRVEGRFVSADRFELESFR